MNPKEPQYAQTRVPECFLIKLKDEAPSSASAQLKLVLQKVNGRTLLEVGNGRAFIVLTTHMYKSLFESLPYVETVGGVSFTPRKIRRIRVKESSQGELESTYVVRNNQIVKLDK
jgi:hypothetical protein